MERDILRSCLEEIGVETSDATEDMFSSDEVKKAREYEGEDFAGKGFYLRGKRQDIDWEIGENFYARANPSTISRIAINLYQSRGARFIGEQSELKGDPISKDDQTYIFNDDHGRFDLNLMRDSRLQHTHVTVGRYIGEGS